MPLVKAISGVGVKDGLKVEHRVANELGLAVILVQHREFQLFLFCVVSQVETHFVIPFRNLASSDVWRG
jgi:hypothetical protein